LFLTLEVEEWESWHFCSRTGAQYIGMGKQIADEYKSADAIFDEASEVWVLT